MRQVMVVQADVPLHPAPYFPRAVVFMDVNLVVLQAAPEALNHNVIGCAALAVHADPNFVLLQQIDILRTGKMTTLVAVDNLRLTASQRSSHRLQYKADFQRLIKLPIHDEARIPVHDGIEIHPTVLHAYVRDVH